MKTIFTKFLKLVILSLALGVSCVTLSAQTYCSANGPSDPTCTKQYNNWVSSVSLGTFTNTTSCGLASGYSNYTGVAAYQASLGIGTAYPLTVFESPVSGSAYFACDAWVDWNANGDFSDPGEYYACSGSGVTNFTATLVPPAGAVIGLTRMRIRAYRTDDIPSIPNSPCGASVDGEVEDYTVNVTTCAPAPDAPGSITGQSTRCVNTTGNYSIASVPNATTYTWSVPAGMVINSGQGTTSVSVSFGTTSGTLSVTATNNCGTSAAQTKTITVSPNPAANAGADAGICTGSSTQLSASGGVSYQWSPSTGLNNANISNPVASPVTTMHYTVTVSNVSGCTAKDEVVVNVNTPPVANAGSDVSICSGSSIQLNAGGGTSYQWNSAAGLNDPAIANPVASPVSSTTYTVTVTDANGCSSTDEVQVTVNPLPVASAGNDVTICSGNAATLNASGGTSYAWSSASGLSCTNCQNPVASPAGNMTYSVAVTDANGCSNTDEVMVTVNPSPTANAGTNATICTGSSIQMNASGGTTYNWSPTASLSNPSISNPVANPAISTTYTVVVGNSAGCYSSDIIVITVDSCLTGVVDLHDVFDLVISPNPSAGQFYVLHAGEASLNLEVINMVGEVVYSENGSMPVADHSFKVDISTLPDGLYFLKLRSGTETITKKIIKN